MASEAPVASSSTSTASSSPDSRTPHSIPFPSAAPAAARPPSTTSTTSTTTRLLPQLGPSDDDHTLDDRSWDHVLDLLKQSLKGCKIKDEGVWLDPIITSLRALVATLDRTTLGAIVDSRIAEDRAQLAETHQRHEANPTQKDRARKGKETEALQSALGGEGGEVEKVKRRERWRNAALLLMKSEESEDEDERSLKRSESSSATGVEAEEDDQAEGLGEGDSAWMSVAEAPKLTIFGVMLCSTETSLSAVRHGTSRLGVEFVRDQWHGKRLFGKSRCIGVTDYEDEDLMLVTRVGGTFYLTATAKELPKLERIIELVTFAAVSLRLEVGLLRDFRCPRPVALPESTPPTPPPVSAEPSGDDVIHEDLDDEVPFIPGAYSPSTPQRKRSLRRSNWSRGSLWGILLGSQNRPKSIPLSRSRSMTVSVIPTRTTATVIVPPTSPRLPSFELSSPTTPSASLRIKNKVKGFSEGLLQRRSRGKQSDGASTPKTGSRKMPGDLPLLEEVRSQSLDLGERRSWDILGGMNLGIFGAAKREEMLSPRPTPSPALAEGTGTPNVDRFQRIINAMETCILSVSPDVVYPPPHLLVRLRQQELAQAPPVDLDAQSFDFGEPATMPRLKSALDPNMLDATPRQVPRGHLDSQALAMNLVTGNLNLPRQDLGTPGGGLRSASGSSIPSSANSRATRITLDARAGLQSLMTANMTLSGTFRHQGMQFLVETIRSDATSGTPPCKPPKWLAYDYYFDGSTSSEIDGDTGTRSADSTLGQILERLVRRKDGPCESAMCKAAQREHCLVLMHSKDRLSISLNELKDDVTVDGDAVEGIPSETGSLLKKLNTLEQDPTSLVPRIASWTSCKRCQASTEPTLLSATSYAFSFAKWTELLLYDPNFAPLPDLCSHATDEKGALVRSFAIERTVVRIVMDQIELFELRLPTAVDADIDHVAPTQAELEQDIAPLELLKTEISSFYDSLRARLANLDERLQSNTAAAMPDSPTTLLEEPVRSRSTSRERSNSGDTILEHQSESTESISSANPEVESTPTSTHDLFQRLQALVEENAQECLRFAECLSAHQLNEGRYFFLGLAKSDKARVAAWELKHAADLGGIPLEAPTYSEPEYLVNPIVHLFPVDSSVIVREDEPSSLIALTLSAKAFQEEVDAPISVPSRKVTPDSLWGSINSDLLPPTRKPSRQPIPAEFTSHIIAATSLESGPKPTSETKATNKALSKSPSRVRILDPDNPNADFAPADEVEFKAKPKKAVRAGSVLQRLGRQRSFEPSAGTGSSLRPSPSPTPTPEQSFDKGSIFRSEPTSIDVLEDLLVTSGSTTSTPPRAGVRRATPTIIAGLSVKKLAAEATTTSVVSYSSASSLSLPDGPEKAMNGSTDVPSRSLASLSSLDSAPSTRPGTPVPSRTLTEYTVGEESTAGSLLTVPARSQTQEATTSPKFLTNAFSTLLSLPDSLRGLGGSSRATNLMGISNSGHTKFMIEDFRHGDKSFRVTAWYAARFRALRARCGLSESLFVESLSRCSDLRPSGGKSSAGFWITGDRRFMLKELVTAWGVSEREAFLSFCPALLDYLMSPQVASLLAKIFGFYTIKVKNHATGEVRKLDLICMEHLFHSTSITRTFDLKGVASRTAKVTMNDPASTTSKTGWDGDWLTQDRLLIYAHSKTLLREALSNDVKFLSDNGGVDYSLLVGVNDEKKELVIGLIDTLGVFNTLKLVEHQVKSGVKKATASDANQVTVLPPTDYATRFKSAMDAYFISVPDKFSKPPGDLEAMMTDPRLASVL
ncbi:BZ3500_MvSof-1268-A1-R1_Chr7-1g09091 [Microbotryum saponariae]|uniref:BZ3500_MvSof-1268-A1-R1_Chr7-1g09091 protein n=1 Tax=Microbotryum saponariae TaxID=289078 RepID=A0A2X0LU63_9BASI|nr:BZ3501_MvSof-1269-A2-R1_Chr7-1g08796 [Microbotryum saponariae]SDA02783.1 BZ3500_MvSof-1268-A1-R1_Chr7-1g09091 [Microbotryum saponariae]